MPTRSGRPASAAHAAVAVAVGCAIQAGCAELTHARRSTELVIWSSPAGVEERGFQRICRRFEREHPGITVLNLGASTEEKLERAIVANDPPDLAYLYNTTPVGPLAANHAVLPLDRLFHQSGFDIRDFLPGAISQGTYHHVLYAMPMTRDSRALYWNKARFVQAGFDPDRPPATLEELTRYAVRLTRQNSQGEVVQLGMYLPDDPSLVLALFGGGIVDASGTVATALRPENVRALRWLVKLADDQGGYTPVQRVMAGFGADESGQNPLATGKVAMRIDGEWAAMYMEKYAPGVDYGIGEIPYPRGRPDLENLAWQDGDVLMIPAGSHNISLAWTFITWMEQPRQQAEYAAAMNNLPSVMALRRSPILTRGARSRLALGYVLDHIASNSHNARFLPALPVDLLYRNALQQAFQRALYHEQTPEQALASVQARVEPEMRLYAHVSAR